MRLTRFSFILALILATGCGAERVILYVGPEEVPCTGVGPRTCLLVREDPEADYEFFYDTIRGFTFEPGYEYRILVRKEHVDRTAADESSIRWTLIRILYKKAIAEPD